MAKERGRKTIQKRIDRLDFIFDLVAGGNTTEAINSALAQRDHQASDIDEIGRQSELRAISLLSQMSYVDSVVYGTLEQDAKGIDLVCRFNNGLNDCFVQVKSSDSSAKVFRRKQRRMLAAGIRIVVLVCAEKKSDQSIVTSFETQLKTIYPNFTTQT